MQQVEHTEHTCPLRNQTGSDAIKDFATILAHLSRDQYDAFQAERARCQQEFDQYVAAYGYHT